MIIHKWTDSRHVCPLSPCNQASHFNSLWSGHVIWMQKGCSVSDQDSCNPLMAIPCGSAGKESACRAGDLGSNPGLGRSPGEGKGYLLQYSGLENSMDCIVHGVTKSWTWLSDFHFWWPWGSQRELIPGYLRPSHGQKVRLGIRTTGCGATTQICNCGKLCHFSGARWPFYSPSQCWEFSRPACSLPSRIEQMPLIPIEKYTRTKLSKPKKKKTKNCWRISMLRVVYCEKRIQKSLRNLHSVTQIDRL